MKFLLRSAAGLLALGLAGCVNVSNWRTVNGSGQVGSEPRAVVAFHAVSVSGSGELVVVQGDREALTIEADDNLLPLIRSEVSGGRLHLGPDGVNLRPTHTIRYRLEVKELDAVNLSGSLRAHIEALKTDRLDLGVSGSGKIQIGRLHAGHLGLRVSGSGDTVVAGETSSQSISISGSGDYQAAQLKSDTAEVHISGSGHASLQVRNRLSSQISGSGSVDYSGHPDVDSHVSGSGRIHRRGDL